MEATNQILELQQENEEQCQEISRLKNLLTTVQNESKQKVTASKKSNNLLHKKNQDLFARFLKSLKEVVNYEGHLEEDKFTDVQLGDLSEHISGIFKSWQNDKEELQRLQLLETKIEAAFSIIPGANYTKTIDLPDTPGNHPQHSELQNPLSNSKDRSSENDRPTTSSSLKEHSISCTSAASNSASSSKLGQKACQEPKFNCNLCDSKFSSLYRLKRHMTQVHGTKKPLSQYKYGCTFCGEMTLDWMSLRLHQKSVHNVPRRSSVVASKTSRTMKVKVRPDDCEANHIRNQLCRPMVQEGISINIFDRQYAYK